MRLEMQLSKNGTTVPYNYQQSLVGAFHQWLGENEMHDDMSLYSLSWLSRGKPVKGGLDFPMGATFFISSPLPDLHQRAVAGIFRGAHIRWGMKVETVTMRTPPDFGRLHRFRAQSPILIKRKLEGEAHQRYYFPEDKEADALMTETLRHKLKRFGLDAEVQVAFDREYRKPDIKKICYHDIDIKGTLCPVIVQGDPRAVQFAWQVGIGNSTGIGFGALI